MIPVPSIPDTTVICMNGGLLYRRANTTRHLWLEGSCPTLHYPPIQVFFSYLTQKVNSSTYYKSRDCRSKDSKESDGADVLKEVPLEVGGEGETRGQLVRQGGCTSLPSTVGSPRLDSHTWGQGCCLPRTAGWNLYHHFSAFLAHRFLTLAHSKS